MKQAAFLTLALISASFASAQSVDNAAYKAAHDNAETTYKAAKKQCNTMKDNAEDICEEEAKVARAQAERDAVAQHKNTGTELQKADRKLVDAKYDLAKEKCDDLSGNAKDSCQAQARSMKADMTAQTGTETRTGVLVDNTRGTVAANAADARDRTAAAADRMGDRTAAAAANAKEKTSEMAQSAREKTAGATGSAKAAMSDTMITAKVKADMAADKTVKAMDVHVETQEGVVMLSGFVPSKTEADRAVQLARGVQGVADVKSSIQVKK